MGLGAGMQILLSLSKFQPPDGSIRHMEGLLWFPFKWKLLTSLKHDFISIAPVAVFPCHPVCAALCSLLLPHSALGLPE